MIVQKQKCYKLKIQSTLTRRCNGQGVTKVCRLFLFHTTRSSATRQKLQNNIVQKVNWARSNKITRTIFISYQEGLNLTEIECSFPYCQLIQLTRQLRRKKVHTVCSTMPLYIAIVPARNHNYQCSRKCQTLGRHQTIDQRLGRL